MAINSLPPPPLPFPSSSACMGCLPSSPRSGVSQKRPLSLSPFWLSARASSSSSSHASSKAKAATDRRGESSGEKEKKGGGVYIYTCVGLSSLPPPLFFVRRHRRRLTPRITCSSCRVGMWGGIRARAIGPQTTAQAIAEVVVGGGRGGEEICRGGDWGLFFFIGERYLDSLRRGASVPKMQMCKRTYSLTFYSTG